MNYKAIYCPYCGKGMNPKLNKLGLHAYECVNCFSISPVAATNDDATAMAQTRVRPPQKPLTLEEACESDYVFCEFRDYGDVNPTKLYHANLGTNIPYIMNELLGQEECYCKEENYGRTWRCWATKPTDEEREAVKWND